MITLSSRGGGRVARCLEPHQQRRDAQRPPKTKTSAPCAVGSPQSISAHLLVLPAWFTFSRELACFSGGILIATHWCSALTIFTSSKRRIQLTMNYVYNFLTMRCAAWHTQKGGGGHQSRSLLNKSYIRHSLPSTYNFNFALSLPTEEQHKPKQQHQHH